ncbi:hypothetical protein SANTM175S_03553 [Streptomyces antimycoticus]
MTGTLSQADMVRMAREGMAALSMAGGLRLLDAGRTGEDALLVPMRLETSALSGQADIPTLLRGVVRVRSKAAADGKAAAPESARVKLAGLSGAELDRALLDLVRGSAAMVLGHSGAQSIEPDRSFQNLGFDSLAGVEFRNRLNSATGLPYPSTLIFDNPTPAALAEYLRGRVATDSTAEPDVDPEEARIRAVLASIPLERLRRAGLLDTLTELASGKDQAEKDAGEKDSIEHAIADEVVGYSVFDRYRQSDGDKEGQYAAGSYQIAFLTVCLSLADWAEETLGEKPELCAGPSFGQRAAVTYAGSLPFEETVRLTAELARCEEEYFAQEHREAVTHCVIHTPEESLRKALGELDDEGEWHDVSGHIDQGFYLVSCASPCSTGSSGSATWAATTCTRCGRPSTPPRSAACAARRRKRSSVGFELADPKLPVVSDQNGALLTEAEGVRTMLLDTFNCPIGWPDMVETMREQGITKVCISGPDNLFGRVNSTGESFEVLAIDARKAMRPRVRQRSVAGRGGDGRSALGHDRPRPRLPPATAAPGHGRPRIVVRRLTEALPWGSAQSAVVVAWHRHSSKLTDRSRKLSVPVWHGGRNSTPRSRWTPRCGCSGAMATRGRRPATWWTGWASHGPVCTGPSGPSADCIWPRSTASLRRRGADPADILASRASALDAVRDLLETSAADPKPGTPGAASRSTPQWSTGIPTPRSRGAWRATEAASRRRSTARC